MRLLRKGVFYFLLAVYLIVCPLTVLYALGYVFTPGTELGVTKTGLLALATVPAGASGSLEGRRYTQPTPTTIRGLFPGDYRLRLLLRNHEPWSRTVSIEAQKATALEHVVLLPKTRAVQARLPEAANMLSPLPGTRFFLLEHGPLLEEFLVYDWQTGHLWPLLPPQSPFQKGQVVWRAITEGSPSFLLQVRVPDGDRFLWVTLKTETTTVVDVTRLFPRRPLWVEWDRRTPQDLLVYYEGFVNRVNVETMAIYPRIADHVRGFGMDHARLYVLTDALSVQQLNRSGEPVDLPLYGVANTRALFGARGHFRLIVLAEDRLLFLGEHGELLTNRPPYQLVDQGVRGIAIDAPTQQVLLWGKDRIGILPTPPDEREEEPEEVDSTITWLFEGGSNIEQALWAYQGSHIVFRDRDMVFLLEAHVPGTPAVRRLVDVQPGSAIAYVEESGTLYFLDRHTGRLSSLDLLPRHTE